MRKINKVKNLAGLLDLASVPQYQNGGETTLEVMLPEVEVYGDQLRRDMQRTGLTYDELSNLNYGAQRQSQIQGREQPQEIEINPLTGNPARRSGDFLIDQTTGQRIQSSLPLQIVSPEFDLMTLGSVRLPIKFKQFNKSDDLTSTIGKKNFYNWGSENYVTESDGYFYKIPKSKTTPIQVPIKKFDERHLAKYVRKKLRFNELPASQKIEYAGYIKSGDKYIPVLKQRAVQVKSNNTAEDKLFNEKALQDIRDKFKKAKYLTSDVTAQNKWYNVFDYGPGHNIGVSSDGTGVIYDAILGESIVPQFFKTISENYQFVNPFKQSIQLLNPVHFRGFLNTENDTKQTSNYSKGGIHKYQNGGYTQEYYDERRRKARWDTSVEQLKNLLSGFNKTFGTAAAGASLLTGGGWALNRLLRRNHPSTLGQRLAPMVLPANTADTAGDVSKMVENPSLENTLDLSSGLILGRFKNLGNPIRQLAELVSQGFNVDDIIPNHSEGGIHIKKKNRGKFTETMKRTGKTAEELKHSKNPLTRKRATFAINARKWAKKK